MEKKISFSEILKKYTMVIVLVFVVIMFSVNTKGVMLLPQNVNNLVAQNAYVFILLGYIEHVKNGYKPLISSALASNFPVPTEYKVFPFLIIQSVGIFSM